MYARIKDGIITELCHWNPYEIYCPELAECFYPCGEELSAGELAVVIQGMLYRDAESIALQRQREMERMALAEAVKNVSLERELWELLGLLSRTGAEVGQRLADCEGRLSAYMSSLCAALDLDIATGGLSSGDIERIREVLYHGGN